MAEAMLAKTMGRKEDKSSVEEEEGYGLLKMPLSARDARSVSPSVCLPGAWC